MEVFKIENLSFTYPERGNKALDDICISIKQGEFVTLCGKSGCGKTTQLKLLKSALAPFGDVRGNIYFKGKLLSEITALEQAAEIGFVMQGPENQIATDKVWHELAFGLESLGYPTDEIRARVAEMASFFGIQNWFYKNVNELSGGQKQLLNLASVMVMQPSVLILDEPTGQLDPIAAQSFFKNLEKINRELGTTIILSEHRLEEVFPVSDRVIVMDNGKIIADGTPRNVGEILKKKNHDMYFALPTPMRVYGAVADNTECPITVRQGREWLDEYSKENPLNADLIPKDAEECGGTDVIMELKDVWFRYEKDLPDVVKGLDLRVNKGELFAIVGGNGTGKTTALSLMSGLNKPYRGEVRIKGEKISKISRLYGEVLGVLPQNPQDLFVKKTVNQELLDMLSGKEMSKEEKEEQIKYISRLCRIDGVLKNHPFDLSGGEQQRVALAKVLIIKPEILLIDEPTKGLDAHFKQIFADIIKDLKADGVTIVMVSHDIEFCAEYADRCAMFFDGNITSQGNPREFFAGKSFYTTAANRMARTHLSNAVLTEDIILACGGAVPERKKEKPDITPQNFGDEYTPVKPTLPQKRKLAKNTIATAVFMLLAIPLTIYAGNFFSFDRKYYAISLLIIMETMIPFCMMFERRKPKARELVLLSVLCAIAVAGRGAFVMLPQFKPVTALIIITGVCFGGETGFLVGAVTAFVSNFFFGQGPWTPWQMFALGTMGFLAGIIFSTGVLRKNRILLCVFGMLATFVVYGGIMNISTVFMVQAKPDFKMLAAALIWGIPYDLVHALATAFFLWIAAEPMLDKLERIKIKYGLIESL